MDVVRTRKKLIEVALPLEAITKRPREGRDAGRIADEVISHIAGLMGSKVTVTLEIQAEVNSGVPDKIVRAVTENCRTLKFKEQGFEES